jgi:hypothetical protein
MIPVNRLPQPDPPLDHVADFRASATSVLRHVVDADGNLDGGREVLVRVASIVVGAVARHADKPWPASWTHPIAMLGELAACCIAEQRAPVGPPHAAWRNLLEALHNSINRAGGPGDVATPNLRRRQAIDFTAIIFAANEAAFQPSFAGDPSDDQC